MVAQSPVVSFPTKTKSHEEAVRERPKARPRQMTAGSWSPRRCGACRRSGLEVGDGAGDAQDAVVAAGAEAEAGGDVGEQRAAPSAQRGDGFERSPSASALTAMSGGSA